MPAAGLLTLGGLLACFGGFKLFRLVLAIYGFMIGAFVSTSATGAPTEFWTTATAIVAGGVVGALLALAAYFVGVGLVGAGVATLGLTLIWRLFGGAEPPTVMLVIVAVLGALGALKLARYVVIIGTALGGSWTLLVGGLALAGDAAARRAADSGEVWVFYPMDSGLASQWMIPIWVILAVFGVVVQLATTGKGLRKRAAAAAKKQ